MASVDGMDRPRLCNRPACGTPAAASLTFQYANRRVWLDNLYDDPDPSMIALCALHADRVSVPVGWSGEDRRSVASDRSESLAG
jgi:hypothetical protein